MGAVFCPLFKNFDKIDSAPEKRDLIKRTFILKLVFQVFQWAWSLLLACLTGGLLSNCNNGVIWIWTIFIPLSSLLTLSIILLRILRTPIPRTQYILKSKIDWFFLITYLCQAFILTLCYLLVWKPGSMIHHEVETTTDIFSTSTQQALPNATSPLINASSSIAIDTSVVTSSVTNATEDTTTVLSVTTTPAYNEVLCPASDLSSAVAVFNYMLSALFTLSLAVSVSPAKLYTNDRNAFVGEDNIFDQFSLTNDM